MRSFHFLQEDTNRWVHNLPQRYGLGPDLCQEQRPAGIVKCSVREYCPIPLFCSVPRHGTPQCYDSSTDLGDGYSCNPGATWEEAQCSKYGDHFYTSVCLRNETGYLCMRGMSLLERSAPEYHVGCGDFRLKCDSTTGI